MAIFADACARGQILVQTPDLSIAWHEQACPTARDLSAHRCINLRLTTKGNLYAWEFARGDQALNVRVDGALIVNDMATATRAAAAGHLRLCDGGQDHCAHR